mgnify:CR=1 FL=1|tara:strand:- start:577 stop:771 length:195 start_codon:yes stop_codon:yes gene_type:complete
MIEHFVGTDGITFDVDSPVELHQAIDILHTQTMDNMPESNQNELLPILEKAMREIEALGYELAI